MTSVEGVGRCRCSRAKKRAGAIGKHALPAGWGVQGGAPDTTRGYASTKRLVGTLRACPGWMHHPHNSRHVAASEGGVGRLQCGLLAVCVDFIGCSRSLAAMAEVLLGSVHLQSSLEKHCVEGTRHQYIQVTPQWCGLSGVRPQNSSLGIAGRLSLAVLCPLDLLSWLPICADL